eukprot:2229200-Prymnesium_polylepis.1
MVQPRVRLSVRLRVVRSPRPPDPPPRVPCSPLFCQVAPGPIASDEVGSRCPRRFTHADDFISQNVMRIRRHCA